MLKSTVLSISIHSKNENPVFGEGVTRLTIDDEAAGGFFVITQHGEGIKINADELYFLASEGKKMMDAYDEVTK